MNKTEKLKGYLMQYPFLQNIHFCKILGVPQNTLKSFVKGTRNMKEETIEKILPVIEQIHFSIVGWQSTNCA